MNHEIWSWFSPHSKIIPCLKSERFLKQITWFTASVIQDKYSDYGFGSLEDWIVWLDWFHDFVICVSWIASFLSILSFTFEHLWDKQNNGLMRVKFWKETEDESFINYRFSFTCNYQMIEIWKHINQEAYYIWKHITSGKVLGGKSIIAEISR